jgi:hypothetical protein
MSAPTACWAVAPQANPAIVCEVLQGRSDLISEAIAGVFAVPDDDFLASLVTA